MCGEHFCSMRANRKFRKALQSQQESSTEEPPAESCPLEAAYQPTSDNTSSQSPCGSSEKLANA